MSLYKRKDSNCYWVKFSVGGKVVQASTGTADKLKAQEFHDRLKVQYWEQSKLGKRPSHSWKEAVVRFLNESSENRSLYQYRLMFKFLDNYLGQLQLGDIDAAVIDQVRQAKLKTGVKKPTVNRHLSLVRSVLNRAIDWDWLDKCPKITMYKEAEGRTRFLTIEEFHKLLNVLPEHLQDMVLFATSTGLRYSNVHKLEWPQVDISNKHLWVSAANSKNKKALSIPLNAQALSVLIRQVGKHPTRVFTKSGKVLFKSNGRQWQERVKQAGLKDFHWHDLRHTWASWAVQNDVSIFEVQKLGGWSDIRMVQRYAHLSSKHLFDAASKLDAICYVPATLPEIAPSA